MCLDNKYKQILDTLTPIKTITIPRRLLVFGTQSYPIGLTDESEYSGNRVAEIANKIRSTGKIPGGKPKVVIVEDSPIVLDGHHRIRAAGMVQKLTKNMDLKDELENITCDVYDLYELGLSQEEMVSITNCAKATYIHHMEAHGKGHKVEYRHFQTGLLPAEAQITEDSLENIYQEA